MRQTSIVIRVSTMIVSIVLLAIGSNLASYWISRQADTDAYAINLAGSLRWQSFRLGMLLRQPAPDLDQVELQREQLERTWHREVFNALRKDSEEIDSYYRIARSHWETLQPILQPDNADLPTQLDTLVVKLDNLVGSIQRHAESNGKQLRQAQLLSLTLILLLAVTVVHWLRVKVAHPLDELTLVAKRIGQGDFTYRTPSRQLDELGILARALNRMSDAIATIQGRMEEQILNQTKALQRSNTALQFLYDVANNIIEHPEGGIDYSNITTRLSRLIEAEDIELCLMTESGTSPYLQIKPAHCTTDSCTLHNCEICLAGETVITHPSQGSQTHYSFPLLHDQRHYGVLVCRMPSSEPIDHWRRQLIQSVADQLAVALSLQNQEDNARRLSLAQERTIIARELHDSLAQTLSYLKIQVTRLNRGLDEHDQPMLKEIADELQSGLATAYRQLRELLTTFRLKADGPGLLDTLQASIDQLRKQTDMQLQLDYRLANLPLTPNEEVHLLQIIREATQNAIHHSGGREVLIRIYQDDKENVQLSVEDDGIGIDQSPEKLNHYGLVIMAERGYHLGGTISIRRRESGGTGVYFQFTPAYRKQRPTLVKQA